ncbi:hypothetical protein K9L97_04935 [Candidatus Woesearchaeota archaeon]|nr:hypothetical protein [Candidatus Woesearchaeota archaeon]
MRLSVFIILLLVLLSFVQAQEYDLLDDSWRSDRETYELEGLVYQVLVNSLNNEEIVFKQDSKGVVIYLGRCKYSDIYKFCYDAYNFSSDKTVVSHSGEWAPGVKVLVYREKGHSDTISPEISVEGVSSIGSLGAYTVNITITNPESSGWINNGKFLFEVPNGINVTSFSNFIMVGNTLTKTLNMNPGSSLFFDVSFDVLEYGSHVFDYVINYSSGSKTGSYSLSVEDPLDFSMSLSPDRIGLEGYSIVEVVLENNNPVSEMIVEDLRVEVSERATYSMIKNFEYGDASTFLGSVAVIEPGKKESFKFRIDPFLLADIIVNASVNVSVEGHSFSDSISKTLLSEVRPLEFYFYSTNSDVEPGDEIYLTLQVKNVDDAVNFNNVSFVVDGVLFSASGNLGNLSHLSSKNAFSRSFVKVPYFNESFVDSLNATVFYETVFGETFFVSKSLDLNVKSGEQRFEISKSSNKNVVKRGEELILTVKVKNLLDKSFDKVRVFESLPQGVEVVGGVSSADLYLRQNQEAQAYLFKVLVLDDAPEIINFRSTVELDDGYFSISDLEVEVEDSQIPVVEDVEDVVAPVNAPPSSNVEPVKEKGFFGKLIDSIEDFFVDLFS